jgi:cob(I)alamin adenosyltransferase
LGLVHIYTGEGKGKTTAAAGLALRALGNGLVVYVYQFMKAESDLSGEITMIDKIPGTRVERFGGNLLRKNHTPVEDIKKAINKGLGKAREAVGGGLCDLLILDEINVAMSAGLAETQSIIEIMESAKTGSVELVLTGRNVPQEIIDMADYVTEMKSIKHPYSNNVQARRGIEY